MQEVPPQTLYSDLSFTPSGLCQNDHQWSLMVANSRRLVPVSRCIYVTWHCLLASQTMPPTQGVQVCTPASPLRSHPINKPNSHEIGQPLWSKKAIKHIPSPQTDAVTQDQYTKAEEIHPNVDMHVWEERGWRHKQKTWISDVKGQWLNTLQSPY